MTREQDKSANLLKINVEIGWKCNFRCGDCHRFFDCPLPQKREFYQGSWIKRIAENLSNTQHIIAVLSGKGGVGKSIISANLAVALAERGYSTAIMDSDLHGPSIPSILGVNQGRLRWGPQGVIPSPGPSGVKVVSMSFLLDDDSAVTWFSDLKSNAQELFLANTDYGYLDYLIVDMPPGTGSETVNLLKYLPRITGVLIVTAPSEVTEKVVRRCISLCRKAEAPIIGLIENMSGVSCPWCGKNYMLGHSSTEVLAEETGITLLGRIARDSSVVDAADRGSPFFLEYPASRASRDFIGIVDQIESIVGSRRQERRTDASDEIRTKQLPNIVAINDSYSCHGQGCFDCSRYFQCTLPKRYGFSEGPSFPRSREAMSGIRHKIAVMSGKGGVGKSTFAANLAVALAQQGKTVTILDLDLHGPCIPKILGAEGRGLKIGEKGIVPVSGYANIDIVSLAFLIQHGEAVTWFDLLKKTTVEQFLSNVDYGNRDYLIIDLPSGTGAESYSVLQSTPNLDGVVIVTLPARNPQAIARRSIALCRQAKVPVIGLVENMSSFVCPGCHQVSRMCGTKSVSDLAIKISVPFIGEIPFDYGISQSCDEGVPFVTKYPASLATTSLLRILGEVQKAVEDR